MLAPKSMTLCAIQFFFYEFDLIQLVHLKSELLGSLHCLMAETLRDLHLKKNELSSNL